MTDSRPCRRVDQWWSYPHMQNWCATHRCAWWASERTCETVRMTAAPTPAVQQTPVILCGPPKDCTCPAVAWTCCCEASEHGRRMIAGLPCDCGVCPTPPTCEITWCEHLAGHGPRNARCRCHGPLVDQLGPGSPDCPDAADGDEATP